MATRCEVHIEYQSTSPYAQGRQAVGSLYHHWDGYPEYMLPRLEAGLRWGFERRTGHAVQWLNHIVAVESDGYEIDSVRSIVDCHGDTEYRYRVVIHGLEATIYVDRIDKGCFREEQRTWLVDRVVSVERSQEQLQDAAAQAAGWMLDTRLLLHGVVRLPAEAGCFL